MNETLKALWTQLSGASAQARWALGAFAALALAIIGTSVVRAQNPHFVVLGADLDTQSFNTAVTALANAGIKYETSMGPAPYIIKVEESKKYEALNAIHLSGQFMGGSRGISSGLSGSSSVFLGQSERHQRTQKRIWEEAEMQLERLNFVEKAKVIVSGQSTSPLARMRPDERMASVTLTLRGLSAPTASEVRALVGVVRGATGVADKRITIVDQHSNVLFDGKGNGGVDSLMALEARFGEEKTRQVQALLDRTFGAGLTVVGVSGTWSQVREESIEESLTPEKKPRMERTRETKSPEWPRSIGGPAGVAANTQEGSESAGGNGVASETASTKEKEAEYAISSKTTHKVSQPHQLKRLSISLVVDESLAPRLADAVALVKGLVAFDEKRGDVLESTAAALPGVERNEEGTPVLPAPVEAPEPTSPALKIALEYGLEFVAGLAFLFVLLKSLKSAKDGAAGSGGGRRAGGGAGGAAGAAAGTIQAAGSSVKGGAGGTDIFDEDVDLDALARAHIEELLAQEPEKVSALLSRWALAEDSYAEAGA